MAREAKHVPISWFVGEDEATVEDWPFVPVIDAHSSVTIAEVQPLSDDFEIDQTTRDYASLIAAAPDMQAALRGLLDLIEEIDGGEHDDAPELVAARTALAKALSTKPSEEPAEADGPDASPDPDFLRDRQQDEQMNRALFVDNGED
jgi:hypothetical protein